MNHKVRDRIKYRLSREPDPEELSEVTHLDGYFQLRYSSRLGYSSMTLPERLASAVL